MFSHSRVTTPETVPEQAVAAIHFWSPAGPQPAVRVVFFIDGFLTDRIRAKIEEGESTG